MAFSNYCSDPKVTEWLREVFHGEDIPSFDESPEFVEALKKIMSYNDVEEKDAKAIIKAEKNMKDFYNEKAEELQLVTDFIQLDSEPSQMIESLASLAEKMKLKEPSLTNFLLAMTEIEDKEQVESEKKLVAYHHISVFSKKIKDTMETNDKLMRNLKSLAKVVETQKNHHPEIMKRIEYFPRKEPNLKHIIKKSEEKLYDAGFIKEDGNLNMELSHSVLIGKSQKLKELEEQLKSLKNKLDTYHSLPPCTVSTAAVIRNKEEELAKLEEDLQMLLQEFEDS